METETQPISADVEQHWRRIIDAVRGSAAAEVWFEFKCGRRSSELPAAPGAAEWASGLPVSVMEDKHG